MCSISDVAGVWQPPGLDKRNTHTFLIGAVKEHILPPGYKKFSCLFFSFVGLFPVGQFVVFSESRLKKFGKHWLGNLFERIATKIE